MGTGIQGNEILLLITVGVLIMLLLAFALVAFFFLSQRKLDDERRTAYARELAHREQLLYSNLQTQEEERRRIAKDLHDAIGSKLNVLLLNLHRLQKQAPATPEIDETVREIFQVIHTTIETTRRISHDLLPPTLESFGLSEALSELCAQYRQSGAVDIQYQVNEEAPAASNKTVDLNLFRVVQELLANSMKHGPAKQVLLQLQLQAGGLQLNYTDDGPGFDPKAPGYRPGLGLQNIESRMRMIGAEFHIQSASGAGLRASINYKSIA